MYVLSVCSGLEEMDAAYDSDEDVDYTKMDLVQLYIAMHMYMLTLVSAICCILLSG